MLPQLTYHSEEEDTKKKQPKSSDDEGSAESSDDDEPPANNKGGRKGDADSSSEDDDSEDSVSDKQPVKAKGKPKMSKQAKNEKLKKDLQKEQQELGKMLMTKRQR